MNSYKRIFIIGHIGAGKALVAKTLAKKLGWQMIDADLGLEFKFGRSMMEIFGTQGIENLQIHEIEMLNYQLNQANVIINTDPSIIINEEIREMLSPEFCIYLNVSTSVQ